MQYDAIFLDINMKEMDGLETAERIRKLSKTVYIVFVTAYITYALEGYKVGAVRYLLKEDSSLENSLKECLDTITDRMSARAEICEIEFQSGKKRIPATTNWTPWIRSCDHMDFIVFTRAFWSI